MAIIACGMMVGRAVQAAEELKSEGISARVVNMATIKPLDVELVEDCSVKCGKIITVEEASIIGGLGSAVAEALAETTPAPLRRIGMNDCFGVSGEGNELLDYFGLNAAHIKEVAHELCGK